MTRTRNLVFLLLFVVLGLLLGNFSLEDLWQEVNLNEVSETQSLSATSSISKISRVVDGDTVILNIEGKETRVRLLGVNAPESVDPRRPVECFGKEASSYLKNLLEGQNVRWETDPSQGTYDKYQRLLAYLWLSEGTFVNQKMISEGYAYEYTYDLPYKYQQEFKKAQQEAEVQKRGLWASGVCQ